MTTIVVTTREGQRLTYQPRTPEQARDWLQTLRFIFHQTGDRVEVQIATKTPQPGEGRGASKTA